MMFVIVIITVTSLLYMISELSRSMGRNAIFYGYDEMTEFYRSI